MNHLGCLFVACCTYLLRLLRFVLDVFRLRSLWRVLCPSSSSLFLVVVREGDCRVDDARERDVADGIGFERDVVRDGAGLYRAAGVLDELLEIREREYRRLRRSLLDSLLSC